MAIVVRSALLWLFLLLVMRALGRKELAQISPFEFVMLVVMGDLIQQGVTAQDTSVTAAALAVSTLALLTVGASFLSYRFRRLSPIIEGIPVVIVDRGRVLHQALEVERLTLDEVRDEARQQGIHDLREVKLGVLEADGAMSFVRFASPTEAQKAGGSEKKAT
jgi:uncharacterized membrane protein YcaP (DUF421 family)